MLDEIIKMFKTFRRFFNHYNTLSVPYDANAIAIKQAYYKLAKKYHPDITDK